MAEDSKTTLFRKESLERLSSPEQLDQLMQVVNPRSWIPLGALGGLLALGLVWSVFGRIPITVIGHGRLVYPSDSNKELVGLSYFTSEDGERIQPGMQVLIIPNTGERTGGLIGEVVQVSDPTIMTIDEARQTDTANTMQAETVEVITQLETDSSTASGYRWSSANGEDVTLPPGITATARVTLREKPPLAFVFPFLDRDY
ncbi:MAG: hypothetical protein VKK04_18115 [Synechococcales bacterium]|nr:hypothetical protein [Synechococcales bacterium]